MKKLLIIPVLIALLFCGCTVKAEKPTELKSISFSAKVNIKNKNYKLNGEIDGDYTFKATVISPKNIKGTYITSNKEKITVQFMGINIEKSADSYPVNSLMRIMFDCVKDASKKKGSEVSGETNGHSYKFLFDTNGIPQKLSVPDYKTEVEFYDVTIKNR